MSSLSKEQIQTLQYLVGIMIPASLKYDVPGADDKIIFETILVASQVNFHLIEEGLQSLDALSKNCCRQDFNFLDKRTQHKVAHTFLKSSGPYLDAIIDVTLQCYYCDERVMKSLGMEARPPFPMGYEVKQGDWSLLDPVRNMEKIYREI